MFHLYRENRERYRVHRKAFQCNESNNMKGFFFSWNFDWEMSLISSATQSLCVFMFYMYHRFNVQQVQYLRSMEKLRVGFEWKEKCLLFDWLENMKNWWKFCPNIWAIEGLKLHCKAFLDTTMKRQLTRPGSYWKKFLRYHVVECAYAWCWLMGFSFRYHFK